MSLRDDPRDKRDYNEVIGMGTTITGGDGISWSGLVFTDLRFR